MEKVWYFLKSVIIFTLDCFIFSTVIVITAFPFLLIFLYKSLVLLLAKWCHPNLVPFENMCASNLIYDQYVLRDKNHTKYDEDKGLHNILGISVKLTRDPNKEKLTLEEIRSLFQTKIIDINTNGKFDNLLIYPSSFGGYFFKKHVKNFNLEDRIYSVQLAESHTINKFYEDWIWRPFGYGNPLWNLVLIETCAENGNSDTYLALRVHHSIADLKSACHIFDILTEAEYPEVEVKDNESILSKVI